MKRKLKPKILIISCLAIILGITIATYVAFNSKTNKDNKDSQVTNNTTNTKEDENQYSKYYYYNKENLERYKNYHALNETMDSGEVVWRVNVNIDLEPYENIVTLSGEEMYSTTALINKYFRVPDDYVPRNLVEYSADYLMTRETLEALTSMQAAASLEGISLNPGSTYRSVEFQAGLYQRYVDRDGQEEADKSSSRAGSSEHHTGRTIDFVGADWTLASFDSTAGSTWMKEHAWEYGFILRYPEEYEDVTKYTYEPWHYTYVGIEASTIMHDEGIATLEEYYVKYVMYQPE